MGAIIIDNRAAGNKTGSSIHSDTGSNETSTLNTDAHYRAGKTGMVKLAVLVVVSEWRL